VSVRPPLARGDVVLVLFPFTDLTGQAVRPAVVLGRIRGDDTILGFITSDVAIADARAEYRFDPADSEFAATGLKIASRVRLDRLATLHRNLIRRRLGHVGPRASAAIAQALRYVFQL
jgi:mRNA interferase MazF